MSNTVKFKDYVCDVELGRYQNNALAIKLISAQDDPAKELYKGEPIATATVNVDTIALNSNQIIVKSYSENSGMLKALMEAGLIGNSTPVNIGHVDVYVAEKTDLLKELEAATCPSIPTRKKKP